MSERPESNPPSPDVLHPAEHRAYRELNLAGRQLTRRWDRIIDAIADVPASVTFDHAAKRVNQLLDELEDVTAPYGVSGKPAAQGAGAGLASIRAAVVDSSVDTGMVLRFAVLDIEHVATLVAHLAELARARGDEGLEAFNARWAQILRPEVKAVRKAAVRSGSDPDRVASPINDSLLTRAAHGIGWAFGSVGEAVDRISSRRAAG